jgi:hypothetical protein
MQTVSSHCVIVDSFGLDCEHSSLKECIYISKHTFCPPTEWGERKVMFLHWLWLVVDCRQSLGNPGSGSTWDKDG